MVSERCDVLEGMQVQGSGGAMEFKAEFGMPRWLCGIRAV
jgi:hypothetical protein